MPTTLHNLRYERMRSGDIRIDRKGEFGNRFVIGLHGPRAEVIAYFEADLRAKLADPANAELRAKVRAMHGKRLFCWCVSEPTTWSPAMRQDICHGEVYARFAAELVTQEEIDGRP